MSSQFLHLCFHVNFRYGKFYLKAAKSSLSKGGDYAKNEIQRLERILSKVKVIHLSTLFTLLFMLLKLKTIGKYNNWKTNVAETRGGEIGGLGWVMGKKGSMLYETKFQVGLT